MTAASTFELLGTWTSDPEDEEGRLEFGQTTIEFDEDGKLTYTVHEPGTDQKMFLIFRVEGQTLITNQPSSPREERTIYAIGQDGKLTLWFGGKRAVYVRS